MNHAARTAALLEVAAQAAAAGHGGKERIYDLACQQYGWSKPSLKRWLSALAAATGAKPRKRRSDAGTIALTLEHAQLISGALMQGWRAQDKKYTSMRVTLERLRKNVPHLATKIDNDTGEILPLSESAVSRGLRHYQLHPDQLRQPTPSQELRSDHPNEVWQIDASISVLFYVPEGDALQHMTAAEFNKNKPGNFDRIRRQRLTRYAITDHYSGSIFVHYVAGGESIVNMAEAFLRCIAQRPDQQMYGVPFHLMMDPGSAGTAGAFGNLLRRLQVQPIVNQAGNPRAKGQVEGAHRLVEVDFESGFKFTHVPSLEWINEQAQRWMRYYNSTRTHGRHKQMRWDVWRTITAVQLRVVDGELARSLLTAAPEQREVSDKLRVKFRGKVWSVKAVPGVHVGDMLPLTVNPYNRASAYVVLRDAQGHESILEVPELVGDEAGFTQEAAHIAHEYKRPADTQVDTNRKALERLVMGADTDEAAAARRKAKAVPFEGRIDPYAHLDDLPNANVALLPRPTTALTPAATTTASAVPERILTVFEAAQTLRTQHGVEMTREKFAQITAWHPQGVLEAELPALAQRLAVRATLRVVGGH